MLVVVRVVGVDVVAVAVVVVVLCRPLLHACAVRWWGTLTASYEITSSARPRRSSSSRVVYMRDSDSVF